MCESLGVQSRGTPAGSMATQLTNKEASTVLYSVVNHAENAEQERSIGVNTSRARVFFLTAKCFKTKQSTMEAYSFVL